VNKRIRACVRTFLLRFTHWAAGKVGLAVLPAGDLNEARERLAEFCEYAMHSGHLRNRYRAGRRVRLLAGQMHGFLGQVWIPPEA
jgi:hypothetical protein